MKRLFLAVALALLPTIFSPAAAQASEITSIDIVAELQADGSMRVTATRIFDADEGTEHYISIRHLGDSEVSDFTVVLDGSPLTDVGEWDVDASREEKAGKSGVVTKDDGYELAFGFGNYGTHTATMRYTVTNVVKNLTDGNQAVYWQFIPRNMTDTQAVSISLTKAVELVYSQSNSHVWGFGYGGTTAIEPDALRAVATDPVTPDNYMVMLAIFDGTPFASTASLDETAQSLEARAKEGSDWEDRMDAGDWIAIGALGALGVIVLGSGVAYKVGASRADKQIEAEGLVKVSKRLAERGEYWRDIPMARLRAW